MSYVRSFKLDLILIANHAPRRVLEIFELKLLPRGYYRGYNDSVNPTVANAFGAAAFRFGHSLVKSSISRCLTQMRHMPNFQQK